jgi:hypothetical protein
VERDGARGPGREEGRVADRPAQEWDAQVARLAVEAARTQQDRRSPRSRRRRLVRRLALAGTGAVLALGLHHSPYKPTVPVCDEKPMRRGDLCMVIAHGSPGSGTFDYDQMQARARHAHDEDDTAVTVMNDVGWAALSIGGLAALMSAAGALRGRPWGRPADRPCPRCGRATLRERHVGVTAPAGRTAQVRLVTLCTAECGHAETRAARDLTGRGT